MTFEGIVVALGALNAAGLFALIGAVWRWTLRNDRRLMRIEGKLWPESFHPTR